MLGGLLTLGGVAVAYALAARNLNSMRYVVFVVVTGASSLVRTGLLEALFPEFPPELLRWLKVCMGPLSAALVLNYLGIWLGGHDIDPLAHHITRWSAGAMLVTALVLGLLVGRADEQQFLRLLQATAVTTMIAVMLGLLISIRAVVLGDPLARWVVLAGTCLYVEVIGLWARSLHIDGFGLGTWIVTALATVAYFLVGSVVVLKRIRQARELERLSTLHTETDAATGLPTGSMLLAEVAHAFWRTARLKGECTVICLRLNNLYELNDSAGRAVEPQIQAAMAARIHRAAGFRCVVGLFHPRCFVVVISADQRRQFVSLTVSRLRALASQPVPVTGHDGSRQEFWPRLGVGVLTLNPAGAHPGEAINEAERRALTVVRPSWSEDNVTTSPGAGLPTTSPAPL